MNPFFTVLLSVPSTVYFNFRYLPVSQAIKLPVWVTYDTNVKIRGGEFNNTIQNDTDSHDTHRIS